jgi:general stress protein 26
MKNKISSFRVLCLLVFLFLVPIIMNAQITFNRDTIMLAAQEIIKETTYCALVTIDSTGQPQIRTMNPFPANNELITWFGTSRYSRKVKEIRNNPKVAVYYADHRTAKGYVNISGTAEVIDNKELLLKMKRDYWESIPNWQDNFVLIKIVPKKIEVINYRHHLTNDLKTFKAPWIILN